MLGAGDVLSIALPAIRYISKMHPNAQVDCLTYDKGREIIALGSPQTKVLSLSQGQWPDNIYQALETFLGLAEDIIGQTYTKIINLDTAFMPCFLNRFLKDAGEPCVGNFMNIPVQELLDKLQNQTLEAEFVNDPSNYMDSTYFGMSRIQTRWWEERILPENGYAEFYLKHCCGFADLDYDLSVSLGNMATNYPKKRDSVVFVTPDPVIKMILSQVQKSLSNQGVDVTWLDSNCSVSDVFYLLHQSKLLVATPGAEHWFAAAVSCPRLLICQDLEPRMLMPDYATERFVTPDAADLTESIVSILSGNTHE